MESTIKKKVVLITYDRRSLDFYLKELETFFEDTLNFEGCCIREGIKNKLECDVILTLSPIVTDIISKSNYMGTDILQGNRTILLDSYDKLKNLPTGTKAMLVSTNKVFALDLASFLYMSGLTNIDFELVYPELTDVPNLDNAITAGQLWYVPERAKHIIDIGWRRISTSTFMTLITSMNIKDNKLIEKLNKYSRTVVNIDFKNTPLDKISKLESFLNIVIDQIDYGVIITNKANKVIYTNASFFNMINSSIDSINVFYLDNGNIPQELYAEINKGKIIDNKVIFLKEVKKELIISKKPIEMYGEIVAYVITIKDVTQVQDLERQLRGQLKKKGYVAKYTFASVFGISSSIKECIKQAKKISNIPKSVLIIGESGTGKEIFAQAIHNYSNRKDKPFVAINCASLPPELLESELFGYEEGAFTGAKKGGKRGLFEIAHTGTLFLDEIGDINLSVQAKLLRVLEEKELMRVGGDNIIPVNVRIIAATNRDLKKLMEEKKFRIDLYYRLNIFTLFLPPLRERREDIPLMVQNFIDDLGFKHRSLNLELMDVLCRYDWMGNVRELKNCVEYMLYTGEEVLTIENLPKNIYKEIFQRDPCRDELFQELSSTDREIATEVLGLLKYKSFGRRNIHSICLDKGYAVSENKIRNILDYLRHNGLLDYGTGRTGTYITKEGKDFLYNISK